MLTTPTLNRPKLARLLLTLLVSLVLPACSVLQGTADNLKVPANVKAYAGKVPRIHMVDKIPTKQELCIMQREHAKQEAFLDGTIAEKKVTYAADCDLKKPKKQEAKTS